jgi:hypothetical protein
MARDPIAEMGQRIRKKRTPEKVGHIVIPAHDAQIVESSLRRFTRKCPSDSASIAKP